MEMKNCGFKKKTFWGNKGRDEEKTMAFFGRSWVIEKAGS